MFFPLSLSRVSLSLLYLARSLIDSSLLPSDLAISCSGNYRSGMVMQGASSEVLMRVNSIVGGGADAHKEGETQIEQDGGGGDPHIMKLKVC